MTTYTCGPKGWATADRHPRPRKPHCIYFPGYRTRHRLLCRGGARVSVGESRRNSDRHGRCCRRMASSQPNIAKGGANEAAADIQCDESNAHFRSRLYARRPHPHHRTLTGVTFPGQTTAELIRSLVVCVQDRGPMNSCRHSARVLGAVISRPDLISR